MAHCVDLGLEEIQSRDWEGSLFLIEKEESICHPEVSYTEET